MATWKVLICDGLDEEGISVLRTAAQVEDRDNISAEELLQIVGDYDAIIVRGRTKVNAAVFDTGKKLKIVGRAGVGVDNIDLEAAKMHRVSVVNAPLSTSLAVAELTLGLMLSIARMLPRADSSMKNGQWVKKQLEGSELYGKTLGIIGIGNIGGAVAKRATAFGMQVIAYDSLKGPEEAAAAGAQWVTLDELFSRSDYISLHVPLTDQTRGMVNAKNLKRMKPGVRLVCAARGGVIDEAALVDALNTGQVAAAGLDVFAKEPPGLTELVAHPNVVVTPHIGAQTEEAQKRAGVDIANEVLAGLQSQALHWRVA